MVVPVIVATPTPTVFSVMALDGPPVAVVMVGVADWWTGRYDHNMRLSEGHSVADIAVAIPAYIQAGAGVVVVITIGGSATAGEQSRCGQGAQEQFLRFHGVSPLFA